MEAKKWYQSWTLWVNVGVLTLTFLLSLAQMLPIPPEYVVYLQSFLNVALRFKTNQPIK